MDDKMAAALACQAWWPTSPQYLRGARLRGCLDEEWFGATAQGRDLHLSSEQSLSKREADVQVHIVVHAPEMLMCLDLHNDEQMARLSSS